MNLLLISLAPVFIIAFYVWLRDKYEKEPVGLLIKALLIGAVITIPVIFIEKGLFSVGKTFSFGPLWDAFAVAGLIEEGFKFIAFYFIIWKNANFNEKFDGIVYAVFISLGFAAVENILYVADGGVQTALIRAVTAVPAHALFGVVMGYHLGLARFYPFQRNKHIIRALSYPVLAHGFYDFCLMSGNAFLLSLFVPYVIWLLINGNRKMKELSELSVFRSDI